MNVQWKTNLDLSSMHAAWCLSCFAKQCRNCGVELQEAAGGLASEASQLGVPADRFWEQLMVLAPDTPANKDLAERLMIRCVPAAVRSDAMLTRLVSAISTMESRFARDYPNYLADMQLRSEPLKQQWDAYGPGLLRFIANQTDETLLADTAEIVLVQPIVGGAGFAHLPSNRCHIEAVLTNVDPNLTETLRLAWLLSQLQFDRPIFSDQINAFRLRRIAGLAMLPPTLRAGEELGICSYSVSTVQNAIQLWRLATDQENPAALAEVVATWWETVEASQPEWRIALTGLDRMV